MKGIYEYQIIKSTKSGDHGLYGYFSDIKECCSYNVICFIEAFTKNKKSTILVSNLPFENSIRYKLSEINNCLGDHYHCEDDKILPNVKSKIYHLTLPQKISNSKKYLYIKLK